MSSRKKDWVLTGDAFDRLLLFLDQDRERAAEQYETLRQMVITFFEYRGLTESHERADETINRVARRLSEGEQINSAKPGTYFYAVARNVWREQLASPGMATASIEDLPRTRAPATDPISQSDLETTRRQEERRLDCLERCLAQLSPHSRELVISYHHGEKGSNIQTRRELAERLGVQPNALRIRVCRIREKLEQCVRDCLQEFAED